MWAPAASKVFGPGWTANLDGTDAGLAGMVPVDSSVTDGTVAFLADDGTALIFRTSDGNRRTTLSPTMVAADDDTIASGAALTYAAGSLVVTEAVGTKTTFTSTTAATASTNGMYAAASVSEPGSGTTTYTRNTAGLVTQILAPVPSGVASCAPMVKGCRALQLTYDTPAAGTTAQVTQIDLVIHTPVALTVKTCAGTDGASFAAGSMATVPVACYTYNASRQLTSAKDPRSGLGTAYSYTGSNQVATVTPAGQSTFTIGYGTAVGNPSQVQVTGVTRPIPGGGTSNLMRVNYQAPLSGAGLPDLTAAGVMAWGQGLDGDPLPTYAVGVFGPEYTGSVAAPSAGDWASADLSYTTIDGYTINTASYGAGQWLITRDRYDGKGNVVQSWSADAVTAIRTLGAPVDASSTQTTFNPDTTAVSVAGVPAKTPAGTVPVSVVAPQKWVTLADGSVQLQRLRTTTSYDEGAPNGGVNPATGIGYGLATTTLVEAVDASAQQAVLGVVGRSWTGYNPKSGDPGTDPTSGWVLGVVTSTTTDMNLGDGAANSGDLVARTFYNAEGRVVESRQPSDAGGAGAGTTLTAYYTAAAQSGADAACGGRPEWAGLVCRTSKAAAAPGVTLPDEATTGYSYLLAPTTSVESSGSTTRTTTTTYLLDGRQDTVTIGSTLAGTGAVKATNAVYDAASGARTGTVDNANQGVGVGSSIDAWGRTTASWSQAGETTTTAYDAAGRVASVTDPMGTTTYTYDGVDASGKTERRGLATKVTVTRSGGVGGVATFTGAYDTSGALVHQTMPGGLSRDLQVDAVTGDTTGLSYSGKYTQYHQDGVTETGDPNWVVDGTTTGVWAGWTQGSDVTGRTVRDYIGQGAAFDGHYGLDQNGTPVDVGYGSAYDRAYTYDQAGRLTTVNDRTVWGTGSVMTPGTTTSDASFGCQVRTYAYTGTAGVNGNRTSQTTADHWGGDCAGTPDATTTVTRAYDTADRATTGGNGAGSYVYDVLGRQTTIPAGDTANLGGGDLTLGYFVNDLPWKVTQAGVTTTFTLDVTGRRVNQSSGPTGGATTKTVTRHYVDGSDNPGWVTDTTGASTRYAEDLTGDLGIQFGADGSVTIPLVNLHGDVVTTTTLTGTDPESTQVANINAWSDYTEYGAPRNNANTAAVSGNAGYGWLGGKQRSTTTETMALTLMGDRLYNADTGRFTSPDPEPGGNPNAYTYPLNPLTMYDLDGHWPDWGKAWTHARAAVGRAWNASYAASKWLTDSRVGRAINTGCTFVWGGIGTACKAVYGLAYMRQGRAAEAVATVVGWRVSKFVKTRVLGGYRRIYSQDPTRTRWGGSRNTMVRRVFTASAVIHGKAAAAPISYGGKYLHDRSNW